VSSRCACRTFEPPHTDTRIDDATLPFPPSLRACFEAKSLCSGCHTPELLNQSHTSGRIDLHAVACMYRIGGLIMDIGSSTPAQQLTPLKECFSINDVRTLVAKQLRVDVDFVTSETHFTDDLGADLLDRVELMLAIEDQFSGVEITDDDVEQIQVVGDLIRHLNIKRGR
jgi:acyl carrier protein